MRRLGIERLGDAPQEEIVKAIEAAGKKHGLSAEVARATFEAEIAKGVPDA
jgi:hypothetical protein